MVAMSKQPPWADKTPQYVSVGFKAVSGCETFDLGYAVYGRNVLLFATQNNAPWRRYWVDRSEALDAANHLAEEVEIHLVLSGGCQHTHDLSLEDFVEHFGARLGNTMH